jgi:hypothetical protein
LLEFEKSQQLKEIRAVLIIAILVGDGTPQKTNAFE